MPHFYNKRENYFISVNYKVMYSTLRIQPQLTKVNGFWLRFSQKPCYAIGRNPYSRLESFYRDKLNKELTTSNKWMRSQKIFFKPLGIRKFDTEEIKYNALKAISFQKFIELLPQVYLKNRHLHPQYKILKNLQVTKKFQMENTDDRQFIENKLHIDLSKKENSTPKENFDLRWTETMYQLVNQLYNEDFKYFQYTKI